MWQPVIQSSVTLDNKSTNRFSRDTVQTQLIDQKAGSCHNDTTRAHVVEQSPMKVHYIAPLSDFSDQSASSAHDDSALLRSGFSSEQPPMCTLCGASFRRNAQLKAHMKQVHTRPPSQSSDASGEDNPCDQSDDSVKNSHVPAVRLFVNTAHAQTGNKQTNKALDQSLRISLMRQEHPDAKYPCKICGKKFSSTNVLYRHVRSIHACQPVRMCDEMERSRIRNGPETDKRRVHMCQVCNKGFTRGTILNQHLSAVHGVDEKRFYCDICSKEFKYKAHIYAHKKRKH